MTREKRRFSLACPDAALFKNIRSARHEYFNRFRARNFLHGDIPEVTAGKKSWNNFLV
jgi:hypothetical protein